MIWWYVYVYNFLGHDAYEHFASYPSLSEGNELQS